MKKIFVTGCAGFIGSNLVPALLRAGYRVIGIDNFDDTYDPAFKEKHIQPFAHDANFSLARIDIRDMNALQKLFAQEKPESGVHLAAKADTRDAVQTPRLYTSVNIEGTLNILELAKECSVKNLVIASSSSVYGNSPRLPWSETEPADQPLSPYGATKRAIELLAHTYHHNFGMNVTCLRYFNAYGENNRPGMVPYLWADALLHGRPVQLSGDGSRSRDYTYISDVVDATVRALEIPLGYDVINIGDSNPIALRTLLTLFEKTIGVTATIETRPSSKASVETTYADIRKANRLLGWKPTVLIAEGVQRFVTWFRTHRLENAP